MNTFEEVEVLEAINSLGGDKAPGPDGMSIAFFRSVGWLLKIIY